MVIFFWNVHVFFIILLRLEAVRVENRGGLKNIAQTLMARGIHPICICIYNTGIWGVCITCINENNLKKERIFSMYTNFSESFFCYLY